VLLLNPLFKSYNLGLTILFNFKPISNTSFLSTILEKVVLPQLQSFLNDNNKVFDVFKSGFRKRHSTETTLFFIMNSHSVDYVVFFYI